MLSLPARAMICGVAAAALAGCTSGRAAQTPPESLAAKVTVSDVKNVQDAQAQELARITDDVKAMDAQQAFLVSEIKSLSDQLAKLRSAVDEAQSAVRSLRAAAVPPEAREPSAPAPPPTPVVEPAPDPVPKTSSAAAAQTPAPPPPAPPSSGVEAERAFAAALAKLRAEDEGQAALEFTEFVARFPSHPLAAAAQNHIGEAYYRQRDFRQALGEFQKTVDGYTQAAQVSEALLKVGLCQRALGDMTRAKTAWEQVVQQFPKSDASRQARALLGAPPAAGQ